MTLFKQIALMLSIFLLIILATVLTLNFQSANKSVQERLYEDAKNTATSLSLSLGSANGDISVMFAIIDANFDSGHYRSIALVDMKNTTIYERKNENTVTDIPEWFFNLVNIEAPLASSNVSDGWSQIGLLKVQSDDTYAYQQLYSIFKNLLISFSVIATIALIILSLLLHVILRPLAKLRRQAAALINNEFIIQDDIPYTKEFQDVVLAMNNMVSKVKDMFDKGNKELKSNKELEYIDSVTQLRNRKYLIDKLPSYLKVDATSKGGVNILIALSGMIEANEKLGHQEVDKLFQNVADILRVHSKDIKDSIVARINPTEFSLLLPECSVSCALGLAKSIQVSCAELIKTLALDKKETFASIGLYEYTHLDTVAQLLSRSDHALTQAKFNKENMHIEKAKGHVEVMGKEAWKSIINEAIQKNKFRLVSWNVIDYKTKEFAHNVLSVNITLDKNTSYTYAQFMASAIQSGLSNDIYKNIVNMLFKTEDTGLSASSTYSLRLPQEYLEAEETYGEISELLRVYAAKLPFKLIVEMPDILIRQDSIKIREYIKLFKKYSIDIGVFEFIGESEDYHYLSDLRPVYIKSDSNYYLSQDSKSLSALKLIADTVGITLIAVDVFDIETLQLLEEKGIHLFQGEVTDKLNL